MDAKELAKAFVGLAKPQQYVTNLKLNKLLYLAYAHGLHNNIKLFNDEIEAWPYGPVVASVYEEYKQYGKERIPFSGEAGLEAQVVAEEILDFYGDYSAFDLVDYLYRESGAWNQARSNKERIISDVRISSSMDGVFEDFNPKKTLSDAARKGDIRWANVYKSLETK